MAKEEKIFVLTVLCNVFIMAVFINVIIEKSIQFRGRNE